MNIYGPGDVTPRQAYVIACGNEKGGSGKTTIAMHLIVALLNTGHKVASIDLDSRQMSLTRYVENRASWSRRNGLRVPMPDHSRVERALGDSVSENENIELAQFQDILLRVENTHDFIVIDTPGHDGFAMRLAHSMADTLVTPINDSFIDFDVLGHIDPDTGEITGISHYAAMVREARRHRRLVDNGLLDWVVVRNRLSSLVTRNNRSLADSLNDLCMRLGCRLAEGISERVIFRELFPIGMTALDELSVISLGVGPTLSHLSARQEIRALLTALKLPIDDVGKRRAQARRLWLENVAQPIDSLDVLAD
ncbi:MAG: division plane positioning ATPase MipZ [Salaquimonas sp.]|nr:division plane positioning ATPase MipZ [Salaquimonas sp.]